MYLLGQTLWLLMLLCHWARYQRGRLGCNATRDAWLLRSLSLHKLISTIKKKKEDWLTTGAYTAMCEKLLCVLKKVSTKHCWLMHHAHKAQLVLRRFHTATGSRVEDAAATPTLRCLRFICIIFLLSHYTPPVRYWQYFHSFFPITVFND